MEVSVLRWNQKARTEDLEGGHFVAVDDAKVSSHNDGMVILHLRNGEMFVANRTGATIWSDIVAGKSVDEIAGRLCRELAIDSSAARQNVGSFISELHRRQLIRRRRAVSAPRSLLVLTLRALCELVRYDLEMAIFGFGRIQAKLQKGCVPSRVSLDPDKVQANIQTAMGLACSFYCKRVRCLQRSVVLVTLLRRYGTASQLVIGYRSPPFLSHAWAEVRGQAIDGASNYAQRLAILHRA